MTRHSCASDKLYLYFIQQGKCMYSGQTIDLARIASDYDIDHIYPQSLVKDDSLENRVLVKRELNDAKADRYPIGEGIRTQMRAFWADLRKRGFIGEEKYRRLTRNTPFTDSERAGFYCPPAGRNRSGGQDRRRSFKAPLWGQPGRLCQSRQCSCFSPGTAVAAGRYAVLGGSMQGRADATGSALCQVPPGQRLPPRQRMLILTSLSAMSIT